MRRSVTRERTDMSRFSQLVTQATELFWAHSPEKTPRDILTADTAASRTCDRMGFEQALEAFCDGMCTAPMPKRREEVTWRDRREMAVQLTVPLVAEEMLRDKKLRAENDRRYAQFL